MIAVTAATGLLDARLQKPDDRCADDMSMSPEEAELARMVMGIRRHIEDLDVQIDGNKIILSGKCHTYYIKQLAQHAIFVAEEGRQIVNNIDVAKPDSAPIQIQEYAGMLGKKYPR